MILSLHGKAIYQKETWFLQTKFIQKVIMQQHNKSVFGALEGPGVHMFVAVMSVFLSVFA